MREELWRILEKLYCDGCDTYEAEKTRIINKFVRRIKQWAKDCVPKEKDQTGFLGHNGDDNPQFSDIGYEIMGYNQAIAEMRKAIEEE